eukprot:7640964-Alexandrium_andersonii.AAC.1
MATFSGGPCLEGLSCHPSLEERSARLPWGYQALSSFPSIFSRHFERLFETLGVFELLGNNFNLALAANAQRLHGLQIGGLRLGRFHDFVTSGPLDPSCC